MWFAITSWQDIWCNPTFSGTNFFISAVLTVEIALLTDEFEIPNIVDINWFDIPDRILRRNIPRDIVDVLLGVFFISVSIS